MSTKNSTHYIRGKGYWMKVLGDPVDNFAKDGKEWVFDLTPDADGIKLLKKLGLSERIKNKDDERGDFITFKQRAVKLNGEANRPIHVVDAQGKDWPTTDRLGNGTDCDVKFNIRPYPGKKDGVYPQAIRVLGAVAYAPQDFAPLDEEDKFFKATPEQTSEFEEALNGGVQAEQILDPFDHDDETA